jgi:poly(hydroxyalkanoate) depolymerase family esterase
VQCSNHFVAQPLCWGSTQKGRSVLNHWKTVSGPSLDSRKWKNLVQTVGSAQAMAKSALVEVDDFGSNPGALRMFTYLPPDLPAGAPLVVVLHGCTQTAAGYDYGAGWSTLADRYGFAVLLPEQQKSNNPNGCFNWFQPGDIERDRGEALSIRQMIERITVDHGLDRKRVFITGLSAGGAMTSVMLATYPEVFAGGGIVAGLPYGAASNVQQAFESMYQSPARPARSWGDLVRAASPYAGPWPRVSVWHGSGDATVVPANASEILKQWTNVHGLSGAPSREEIVDGYPRRVWSNADGDDVIESYTITSMAHGTPLAMGDGENQCGAAGAFLLDVGISSSFHMAKFWGLTGHPRAAAATDGADTRSRHAAPAQASPPPPRHNNVGDVITRALKAAGLIKAQ